MMRGRTVRPVGSTVPLPMARSYGRVRRDHVDVESTASLPDATELARRVAGLYRRYPWRLLGAALAVQVGSLPVALWAGLGVVDAERLHRPLVVSFFEEQFGSQAPYAGLAIQGLLLATEGVFRAYQPALALAVATALGTMVAVPAALRPGALNVRAALALVAAATIVVLADVAAFWAVWRSGLDRSGVDEPAFAAFAIVALVLAVGSLLGGTWFSVRWSLAPALIASGVGLRDAVDGSDQLVNRRWWLVSALLLLAILAAALAFAPVAFVLSLLPPGEPAGIAAAHLAQAIVAPIVPLTVALIARDLAGLMRGPG